MAQSKSEAKADDCVNDDTVQDTYGDTCTAYYDENPAECGNYDSDTFVAADSCCACMGLSQMEDTGEVVTADTCVNDDTISDSYDDTCSMYYDDNPD